MKGKMTNLHQIIRDLNEKMITYDRVNIICHCGRILTKEYEIEFYNHVGECAFCDHIRSEKCI